MTDKSGLQIVVPANWRPLIGTDRSKLECQASTVGGALEWLATTYPQIAVRLFSKNSRQVASWINVYLGDDDIRDIGGLQATVEAPAVLTIIQAVAGG
jgi:sulfur-carrier protein